MDNTFIDGNLEKQIQAMKEFCGLSPEQSFDEINLEKINNEEEQAR